MKKSTKIPCQSHCTCSIIQTAVNKHAASGTFYKFMHFLLSMIFPQELHCILFHMIIRILNAEVILQRAQGTPVKIRGLFFVVPIYSFFRV